MHCLPYLGSVHGLGTISHPCTGNLTLRNTSTILKVRRLVHQYALRYQEWKNWRVLSTCILLFIIALCTRRLNDTLHIFVVVTPIEYLLRQRFERLATATIRYSDSEHIFITYLRGSENPYLSFRIHALLDFSTCLVFHIKLVATVAHCIDTHSRVTVVVMNHGDIHKVGTCMYKLMSDSLNNLKRLCKLAAVV